jgi:adenosine deaminase
MKITPKLIDLHLHLDGAITVDIAKKLAKLQGITLPAKDDEQLRSMLTVPADCTSLNDFLSCFALPDMLMQTKEGLREAVRLVLDEAASHGVVYAELRFAPQLHTDGGMTQEQAVIAALEGAKGSELKCNLILCCMRGADTAKKNFETLELAKKYLVKDGGVAAIDLAGAEALFPTKDYKALFAKAKEYGVPFTIHAGEADGADSIRDAIEFGACRIGHGVRCYEDEKLLKLVIERGIPFEMCPTSNRQTHAVENMDDYPFMDYLNKGVKVTLNTDDPAIEGTTLQDEYRYMKETFNLTAEQEKQLLSNAAEAAFTTDEVKAELKKELQL